MTSVARIYRNWHSGKPWTVPQPPYKLELGDEALAILLYKTVDTFLPGYVDHAESYELNMRFIMTWREYCETLLKVGNWKGLADGALRGADQAMRKWGITNPETLWMRVHQKLPTTSIGPVGRPISTHKQKREAWAREKKRLRSAFEIDLADKEESWAREKKRLRSAFEIDLADKEEEALK